MGYIEEQIVLFVEEYFKKNKDLLKYDRTIMGKVTTINSSTATIESGGQKFTCRIKHGITIAVGDVVIVKIPNNNKDYKYIDGKLVK